MQTNRLIFKDNDLSFSVPQPAGLQGFAVVRSPKGTTTPQYIESNDTNKILELFGAPSSTYPGLKEVIDFNKQHGIWLSAPAGYHTGLSNYFGGVYVTTEGSLENFLNTVSESANGEPNVDYLASWTVKNQSNTGISPFVNGVTVTYDGVGKQIVVDNIQSKYFTTGKIGTITLSFPKDGGGTHSVTFYLPSGGTTLKLSPAGANSCGTITGTTTLTMNITGDTAETSALYTDLQNAVYMATLTAGQISVAWTQNIQDNVIMSFYQNSIRSIPGTFTLNSVDIRPVVVNPLSSGISFGSPVLATPLTATFAVTGVSSTITAQNPQVIKVGSVPVTITSTDNASTTLIAAKIAAASASFGAGWTVTNNTNTVTITSTTPIIGDSRANPNYNTLSFTYLENSYASISYQKTFTVSTDMDNKTAAGESRYVQDVIGANNFIRATVNKQIYDTSAGITWNTASKTLEGFRIVSSGSYVASTDLATTLQAGWDRAAGSDYEDVLIFFDPEFCSDIIPTMSSLRATTSLFSTFVNGLRVPNAASLTTSDALATVNALISKRAGLPNVTGLAYYCNELYTTETYTGTSFWTIPVGAMSAMLGKIMLDWLGGKAPMWINENSVGGQISVSATKQKYSFTADMLDSLDAAGINPIVKSNEYGIMATSQKTAQDSANLTDWSFLGHQMAFDLFKREMRSAVMIPQIGKAIDDAHMELRQRQSEVILNKRTQGTGAIWNSGKIYIKEVNTDETKLQNNFIIKARVKVSPFSEYVTLILENLPQTGTV